MNNYIPILIIGLLANIVLSWSCKPKYQGLIGSSASIEDSKNKKVFVKRYFLKENPFFLKKNVPFKIQEAWLENRWSWFDYDSIIRYPNSFEFLIVMDSSISMSYNTVCCKDNGEFEALFLENPKVFYNRILGGTVNISKPLDSISIMVLDTVWTNDIDSSRLNKVWFYRDREN